MILTLHKFPYHIYAEYWGKTDPYCSAMSNTSEIVSDESGYLSDDLDLAQPFVYTNSGRGYQLGDGSLGNSDKRYQALPNA